MDTEEEMRKLSLIKEKFATEREHTLAEMKRMEVEIAQLRATNQGQLRLIQNVTGHQKTKAAIGGDAQSRASTATSQLCEESERNERLAEQLTRSKFMQMSDNPPPRLESEKEHPLLKLNWPVFVDKNRNYMTDDSVPPQIYSLIESYRDKARGQKPGNDLAMLIDDFFGEAH